MANYVNFCVNFEQINEAATAKLKELYGRIRNEPDSHAWFSDMFVEGDLSYEDTGKYSWTTANIGPKWCYLEDYDETMFNGTSAWIYPEDGIIKLLEILYELDPFLITTVTYEDEGPNFAGCAIFQGDEQFDGFEDDYDEIREGVIHASEVLTEDSWDDDEEEWADDEAEDRFNDELWEFINDRQMEVINSVVEQVKEDNKNRDDYT